MNVHLMRASLGVAVVARVMLTAAAAPIPGERAGGCAVVGGSKLLYAMGGGGRLYGDGTCPKADGDGNRCSPEATPPYALNDDVRFPATVVGRTPEVLSLVFSTSGGSVGCLANAPAFQVARFSCLFLKYFFRTTKTPTARSARRKMVTMAPTAPPEIPLDDAASELPELVSAEEGVVAGAGCTVNATLIEELLDGLEVVAVV